MIETPLNPSFNKSDLKTEDFFPKSAQPEYMGVSILTKPKQERTDEDINYAIKVLKAVPFFSSMQRHDIEKAEMDKLLAQVFEYIKCQTFKQGEIVFQHREKASKFYVIVEGNVDIYVPRTDEEIDQDIEKIKTLPLRQLRFSTQRGSGDMNLLTDPQYAKKSLFLSPMADGNSDTKPAALRFQKASSLLKNLKSDNDGLKFDTINSLLTIKDCFHMHENHLICKYKKVRTLGPGEQFGELALLSDCDRSATVVAASNLQVATLCKKSFTHISRNFKKIFRSKIDFFAELMNREPENSVGRICYGFKERQYIYGQKIYTQGQIPTEVFIVKHGEVQLSMLETQEKTNPLALPCISKTKKPSTEKIAALGSFSFLGQSEALEGRPYEMTATSYSNGTVLYVIPVKEFKNLKKTFPDAFQNFTKKNHIQMSYFENRADIFSARKKILDQTSFINEESEKKSPKPPAKIDISQLHSPKFFEKRMEQLFSPQVKDSCLSQRLPIKSKESSRSSNQSIINDSNFNIMSSPKSLFHSSSKNKKEFSIAKDAFVSRDYDLGLMSYRQPIESDPVKINKEKSCDTSQEFSVERTLKMLKEKAKLRRSLSKDFGAKNAQNGRSSVASKRSSSNQPKN